MVWGSAVSSPSGVRGGAPTALDALRPNVSSSHKCLLVPVSRFNLAEPLDAIGRTPVEKHCHSRCNCRLRVIDRNHSFLQNAEFRSEPRNLLVSAEFLCFL